jgi:heme oxygenase
MVCERSGRSVTDTRQPRSPRPVPERLSVQLRRCTRDAHRAVEQIFDLDRRLVSRASYGQLLLALRRFYGPTEDALDQVTGWQALIPPIHIRTRRRAALIDDDLAVLGIDGSGQQQTGSNLVPMLGSLAAAIGCLYVLEGSSLGGQIISARARATLGEKLPVRFFGSADRADSGRDWRSLQLTLDDFGAARPAARGQVVRAAHQTFAAFGECLGSPASRRD